MLINIFRGCLDCFKAEVGTLRLFYQIHRITVSKKDIFLLDADFLCNNASMTGTLLTDMTNYTLCIYNVPYGYIYKSLTIQSFKT